MYWDLPCQAGDEPHCTGQECRVFQAYPDFYPCRSARTLEKLHQLVDSATALREAEERAAALFADALRVEQLTEVMGEAITEMMKDEPLSDQGEDLTDEERASA
jgi:hypothetical protein